MRNIKKIVLLLVCLIVCNIISAQSYNQEYRKLSLFIERMYENEPFEGCRIIDDYEHSYLLSVVVMDKNKYQNEMTMNRVAQVKSQRNAGEYLNGAVTYSEITIKTPESEEKGGKQMTEVYDLLKQNTTGFVQQMQLLSTFVTSESNKVYVFCKEIK